LTTLRIVII